LDFRVDVEPFAEVRHDALHVPQLVRFGFVVLYADHLREVDEPHARGVAVHLHEADLLTVACVVALELFALLVEVVGRHRFACECVRLLFVRREFNQDVVLVEVAVHQAGVAQFLDYGEGLAQDS